jgi:hypothetical protein
MLENCKTCKTYRKQFCDNLVSRVNHQGILRTPGHPQDPRSYSGHTEHILRTPGHPRNPMPSSGPQSIFRAYPQDPRSSSGPQVIMSTHVIFRTPCHSHDSRSFLGPQIIPRAPGYSQDPRLFSEPQANNPMARVNA